MDRRTWRAVVHGVTYTTKRLTYGGIKFPVLESISPAYPFQINNFFTSHALEAARTLGCESRLLGGGGQEKMTTVLKERRDINMRLTRCSPNIQLD